MISEMQRGIILGQSQNQAINLIKEGLSGQDVNLAGFLESDLFENSYNRAVEVLFRLNIEQQNRLIGGVVTQSDKPSEKPKETGNPTTKPCPQCKKQMPFSWKFHQECGWKGN